MDIKANIQALVNELSFAERAQLKEASRRLSERYAQGSYEKAPLAKLERYAYVLTRMPATRAAICSVLKELDERLPGWVPKSCADIGAGPATASWAALSYWPGIESFQLVEKDPQWIKLGQRLASSHPILSKSSWSEQDLCHNLTFAASDLLIASYALQELSSSSYAALAQALFSKTNGCLVLLEPGTPKGFANLRLFRTLLLELGAHVLAPCTHTQACPLQGSDWCHFSTRLTRDDAHRFVKDVSLSYEDEKYAYLIVTREVKALPYARLIRAPIKRSGHVILDTCTKSGLERTVISRSHKKYKQTKKLSWGSAIDEAL